MSINKIPSLPKTAMIFYFLLRLHIPLTHINKKKVVLTYIRPLNGSFTIVCFRAQMRTAPDRLKHPLGFKEPCLIQVPVRAA